MIQSQTKFLHRSSLETWSGNSLCSIPLKFSRFGYIWTISDLGEFEEGCKSGIMQIKRDGYFNIGFHKTYAKLIKFCW